jgi:protein involved in polysaccharide export with SLBB domain
MKLLALAACVLFLAMPAARAQDTLTTQKAPAPTVDPRGLPPRSMLPPFGANLFGGTPPTATLLQRQSNTAQSNAASSDGTGVVGGLQSATTQSGTAVPPSNGATNAQSRGSLLSPLASDPNYQLQPGDVVQVRIYGAATVDTTVSVDPNGDIFVPPIGPIHVGGIALHDLQATISKAVQQTFIKGTNVYAGVVSATPISVFVTGPVVRPGQYLGTAWDSVISFLQYAGGIDPARGSYRHIALLHGGGQVAEVDLYEFLLSGTLPATMLHNGDTIVVGPQGPTVTADGDVRGAFRYELKGPGDGAEVIQLARPYPDATNVSLIGVREGRPRSFYLTLDQFQRAEVKDDDAIHFIPDVPTDIITVTIDGRVLGPTSYVVRRGATLLGLLAYVPVNPQFADIKSIYLRRTSVALQQKQSIDDTIRRLQQSIITSPSTTSSEASLKQQEADVITRFAEQLRSVQPEGRVIVSRNGQVGDVMLENGDVIVLPSLTDLVVVSGEVAIPQSVLSTPGFTVEQYVKLSGGWTERSDKSRIIVQRASGETLVGSDPPVGPGDKIIVLPAADSHLIPIIKDITEIVYQIAIGVGVLVALH